MQFLVALKPDLKIPRSRECDLVLGFITWVGLLIVVVMYGALFAILLIRELRPATVRISLWMGLLLIVVVSALVNLFIPLRSSLAVAVVLGIALTLAIGALVLQRSRLKGMIMVANQMMEKLMVTPSVAKSVCQDRSGAVMNAVMKMRRTRALAISPATRH